MTPKEIEDIRSWRRGEWVADVTEIESMVYGVLDELDRLRAAVGQLALEVDIRREVARLVMRSNTGDADMGGAAYVAYNNVRICGRELGLFSEPAPGAEITAKTEPGGIA